MSGKYVLLALCLAESALFAQQGARVDLGRLQTGATVSFTRAPAGEWGIEIAGAAAPLVQILLPRLTVPKPCHSEVVVYQRFLRRAAIST